MWLAQLCVMALKVERWHRGWLGDSGGIVLSAPPQLPPSLLVASEPKGSLSEPRPRTTGALKQQAQKVRNA